MGKKGISRRCFLETASSVALTPWLGSLVFASAPAKDRGTFLIPAVRQSDGSVGIAVFETKTGNHTFIKTRLKQIHAVAIHPIDPNVVIVLTREMEDACEINMAEKKVARYLKASPDHVFYGHGVFDKSGRYVFVTESDPRPGRPGTVTVRDGKDWKLLDRCETSGRSPHDICLSQDGKTLVVANSRPLDSGPETSALRTASGSVAFLDPETFKLKQVVPNPNREYSYDHLALINDNEVAVGANSRRGTEDYFPAPIVLGGTQGLRQPAIPANVLSSMVHTLSVAIDPETKIAGFTHMVGSAVTFWDFKKSQFLKKLEFPNDTPMGLTLTADAGHFVMVTSGHKVHFINKKTLEVEDTVLMPASAIAHTYRWPR